MESLLEKLVPRPGERLLGRYEIVRELGRGGFGVVFLARQTALDEFVAIKVLLPHVVSNSDVFTRFEREVQVAKGLRHPNTIRLLDCDRTPKGLPFYIMEYVEGVPLADLLSGGQAISERRTRRVTVQILKSLAEAHSRGVIHRDLKPANVLIGELVGEPTFVKVLDFGIAKALAEGDIAGEQTETGLILGTPAYMSPEQVRGKRDIDGRSDLYAVGLIMAECLSGVRVCRGETPFSILAQHTSSDPHDLMPAVRASSLAQIIEQAVAKDADDRFHSATAMREAIEAIPVDSLSDSPAPAVMVDVSGPANTGPTVTPSASSQKPDRQMQIGAAIPDDETVGAVVSITSEPSPTPSRILALILLVVLVGSAAVVAWIAGQTPDPAPGPGPATDTRATCPEPERADDDRRGQTGDEDASALAQDADADETTHHGSGPSQDLVSAVLSFTVAQERVYSALPRVRSIAFEGTEGARVYLDDQTIGSVPFSVPFPALDVQLAVRAERDGFRTRAIDFSLTQDNVTVVLRRQRQTAEAEPAERDPEPPENENDMGSGGDEADAQETDLPFGLMPIYDNSP